MQLTDSDFLDLCEEDTSSLRVMTDEGTGGGGADSGGGGGGGAAAELGGGGGGAGCMPVDEEVAGGGTAFGGVVESGEWPDDCFETGVGGNGGGPESLLLFRLGEDGSVENGPVDDDSDELELFGMYDRVVVTCKNLSTNDLVSVKLKLGSLINVRNTSKYPK